MTRGPSSLTGLAVDDGHGVGVGQLIGRKRKLGLLAVGRQASRAC